MIYYFKKGKNWNTCKRDLCSIREGTVNDWMCQKWFELVNRKCIIFWTVVAEPWKMLGFLASEGEEFNPGPVTRFDCSELLCNKVLLKYKRDRESFWLRHQKGAERLPPCQSLARCYIPIFSWMLYTYTSPVAQMVKHLPTMQETWVLSLGWDYLLEKEMATHSSTPAWKIPWIEEPGRLQSKGLQRLGHDWATSLSLYTYQQAVN